MKSNSYKNSWEVRNEKLNLWDAFVNHLDSLYFSGASELLDNQTIAFEYDSFLTYFT